MSLRALAIGTILLALGMAAYGTLGLPSTEEIEVTAAELVRVHGYWILFAAALLESMFLLGLAFPGTTILVVGIALAPSANLVQLLVASTVAVGGFLGYSWDYVIGRLGWHLLLRPTRDPLWLRAHTWTERYGALGLAAMVAHPMLGAPASVSAGALGMGPLRFAVVMVVSTTVWAWLWTSLLFALGSAGQRLFAPMLSIGWLVLVLAAALTYGLVRELANRRGWRRR